MTSAILVNLYGFKYYEPELIDLKSMENDKGKVREYKV
jgi:hypothetical protein